MFYTTKLALVHTPKTGGHTACGCLRRAIRDDVVVEDPAYVHKTLGEMPALANGRLTCAFVRNPLDWYRSAWTYLTKDSDWGLWLERFGLSRDRQCKHHFEHFVRAAVYETPGLVSAMYRRYTKHVQMVGRTETLYADMATMLERSGHVFDAAAVTAQPALNTTRTTPRHAAAIYSEELFNLAVQAEAEAIDLYRYRDAMPDYLDNQRASWKTSGKPRRILSFA